MKTYLAFSTDWLKSGVLLVTGSVRDWIKTHNEKSFFLSAPETINLAKCKCAVFMNRVH